MDFNLTDIQQDFLKLAHDFGEKKLAPTVTERDHKGIYDKELIDELLSLGITGAYFEEKYGGSGDDGGDVLSYILAVEELAKYDAGVAITLSATGFSTTSSVHPSPLNHIVWQPMEWEGRMSLS